MYGKVLTELSDKICHKYSINKTVNNIKINHCRLINIFKPMNKGQ